MPRTRLRNDATEPRADSPSGIPHDQILKQSFVDEPEAALRFFAGAAAARTPRGSRIWLLRQEQVSEILGRGHRIADVVAIAEPVGPGASPGQVYYLFEGSAHASRDVVYKLARLTLDLGEWLERVHPGFELIPVLDVVDPGHLETTIALGTKEQTHLSFKGVVVRIAEMDAQKTLVGDNPVALANVMNMRMKASRRILICAEALTKLKGLMKRAQWRKYSRYVMYSARFNRRQRIELQLEIGKREPGMIETLFDDWEKKGKAKGKAEGKAEGLAEGLARGKASALLQVLEGRRLSVTAARRRQIHACRDATTLDRWLAAAVNAKSSREVFSAPKRARPH